VLYTPKTLFSLILSGASTSSKHRPNLETAFRPLGNDLRTPAYFLNFYFVVLLILRSVIYAKIVIFTDFCLVPALLRNVGPIGNRTFGHSAIISDFQSIFLIFNLGFF
jgi:hypothetical protein